KALPSEQEPGGRLLKLTSELWPLSRGSIDPMIAEDNSPETGPAPSASPEEGQIAPSEIDLAASGQAGMPVLPTYVRLLRQLVIVPEAGILIPLLVCTLVFYVQNHALLSEQNVSSLLRQM